MFRVLFHNEGDDGSAGNWALVRAANREDAIWKVGQRAVLGAVLVDVTELPEVQAPAAAALEVPRSDGG